MVCVAGIRFQENQEIIQRYVRCLLCTLILDTSCGGASVLHRKYSSLSIYYHNHDAIFYYILTL